MSNAIEITRVSHAFGAMRALDDVSLSVPAGSFTVLLGPSGSGKTTLLSLLGGFLAMEQGSIVIGGKDMNGVPAARRPTATVFQDYALFPHMTIAGNVGFGLRMAGVGRQERHRRVGEMLDLVGLPEMAERRPHALSGGQKQRVALARALAIAPAVLLLDEPLGALDLKLRRQMQAELTAIQKRVGATFVHVTHDQEEALAIADRIVVMNHGKIADLGSPEEIYLRPRSVFAATFVGQSNRVAGRVAEVGGSAVAIDTSCGRVRGVDRAGALTANEAAVAVMRPEHLVLTHGDEKVLRLCEARLSSVVFMGAHQTASLVTDHGSEFIVQTPQGVPLIQGKHYEICYDPDRTIILPEGT